MIFSIKIGNLFSKLEKDRSNADYEISFESTEKKAKKDLLNAEKFIEECKKFL